MLRSIRTPALPKNITFSVPRCLKAVTTVFHIRRNRRNSLNESKRLRSSHLSWLNCMTNFSMRVFLAVTTYLVVLFTRCHLVWMKITNAIQFVAPSQELLCVSWHILFRWCSQQRSAVITTFGIIPIKNKKNPKSYTGVSPFLLVRWRSCLVNVFLVLIN